MANIAFNQCIITGKLSEIKKLYKHLVEIEFEFNHSEEFEELFEEEDDNEVFAHSDSFDSRWEEPVDLLKELTKLFDIEISGNTFEKGMDYISMWKFKKGHGAKALIDDDFDRLLDVEIRNNKLTELIN